MGNLCGAGEQRLRDRLIREYEETKRQELQTKLEEEARLEEEELRVAEEEAARLAAEQAAAAAAEEEKKQKENYIRELAAAEIQTSIPVFRQTLDQVANSTEAMIHGVSQHLHDEVALKTRQLSDDLQGEMRRLREDYSDSLAALTSQLQEQTASLQQQLDSQWKRVDLNTARGENLNDEVGRVHEKVSRVRERLSHVEDQQLLLNTSIDSLNAVIDRWNDAEAVSPALEAEIQNQVESAMLKQPKACREPVIATPDSRLEQRVYDLEIKLCLDSKYYQDYDWFHDAITTLQTKVTEGQDDLKTQLEGLRTMQMQHARKIKELETQWAEYDVDSEVSFIEETDKAAASAETGYGEGAGGGHTGGAKFFNMGRDGSVSPPGTPRSRANTGQQGGTQEAPLKSPDKKENPYDSLFRQWGEHSELDPRSIPRLTRFLDNTNEYQSIGWNVLNHVWVKSKATFTIFDNQQSKNSQYPPLRAKHTLRVWKAQVFLWAYAILRCGGSRVGLGNQIITKSFQDGFEGELHLCAVESRDIASLMFAVEDGFQPHLNLLHEKVEELLQHTVRMDGMPIDLYFSLLGTVFKYERELSDGRNIRNDRSRARFALDTMGIRSEIKGVLRLKMADLDKNYEFKDFATVVRHMNITDSKRYDLENQHQKNKKGERDFLNELLVMFNILEPGRDNIENFSLHQKVNQYFRNNGGGANAGQIFQTTAPGGRPTGPGAPSDSPQKDQCPLGENCNHLSTTGICKKRHTRKEYAICLQKFEEKHPDKYRKWKAEKEKRAAEKKKNKPEENGGGGDKK
eukprot:g18048.t1